jgi:hypothetical protein
VLVLYDFTALGFFGVSDFKRRVGESSKYMAVTVDLSGLIGCARKLADDFDAALTDQNR